MNIKTNRVVLQENECRHLFYLPCECSFAFLLVPRFNNQHVHPHPVVTAARTSISRPTTIPRTFLVTSQLFVLVSSCCVIDGLVLSDVNVCVSLMTVSDDVRTMVVL